MDGLKLMPRRPEKLGDQLYGQILEQIVAGTLKEGQKLPSESQMCKAFQVSRPTVREALMRLNADGLVATRQGSGTFVRKRPSPHLTRLANVSDVAGMLRCLEVRMALECQAASLAAQRHTTEELNRINTALAALRHAFDGAGIPAQADLDFHRAVAQASGNALFPQLLDTLAEAIQSAMTVALSITRTGSRERAGRVVEEHEGIAEAIAQGDAEAAALAMRYHLHRSRQRVTDGQRDM